MKTVIKNLLAEYDMSNSAFAKDLLAALAEQTAPVPCSQTILKLALAALKELVAQTESGLFAVRHDHVAMQDARQAITALREALAEAEPTTTESNGGKTGWPPGLLQDDCKGLSKWLSNKPDAKRRVREALDKTAKNERELGIQMQPAQQEPVAYMDICEKNQMSGLRYWSEPDNRHEVALYTSPPAQRDRLHKANQAMLEALEEIALTGMSGSGHESEDGMTAWHASQAWKCIGIAARAIEAAHGIKENT